MATASERSRTDGSITSDEPEGARRRHELAPTWSSTVTVRPHSGRLVVVLLSVDPRREQHLRAGIGPDADVIVVDDVMELIDLVHAHAEHRPYLVIDGAAPSVQPSTLATVAPELPENGFRVVLWGVDDGDDDDLRAVMPGASAWLRFPVEIAPQDLATILRGKPR